MGASHAFRLFVNRISYLRGDGWKLEVTGVDITFRNWRLLALDLAEDFAGQKQGAVDDSFWAWEEDRIGSSRVG